MPSYLWIKPCYLFRLLSSLVSPFVLFLLLPPVAPSYAQTRPFVDSAGFFRPVDRNVADECAFPDTTAISLQLKQYKLDSARAVAVKKQLLQMVNEAILNLEDDSLGLALMYKNIWRDNKYELLYGQLKQLRLYLSGKPYAGPFTLVPDPAELEKEVMHAGIFGVNEQRKGKKPVIQVVYKDPLQHWLFNRYGRQFANTAWVGQTIDRAYLKGWRKLEQQHQQLKVALLTLQRMKADIFQLDTAAFNRLKKSVDQLDAGSNDLVKWLRADTLLAQWLWYTQGYPNINPLLATTADRKYPAGETNTYFTKELRLRQDSLEKADVLGRFQTTRKVHNELEFPQNGEQRVLQYDAQNGFRRFGDFKNGFIDDEEKDLAIAVYNLPANDKFTYTPDISGLKYESPAITALNKAAESAGAVISLVTQNMGGITTLLGVLSDQALKPVQPQIKAVPADRGAEFLMMQKSIHDLANKASGNTLWGGNLLAVPPARLAEQIYVNGRLVPLTKTDTAEDKKRIIWIGAVDFEQLNETPDPYFTRLVETFLARYHYFMLDYSSVTATQKKAWDFFDLFLAYRKTLKERLEKIDTVFLTATEKYNEVNAFVRIVNRSLPPYPLTAATDPAPSYRTELLTPEVGDAPKKYNYKLTVQSPDMKEPVEVVSEKFKVVKRQRIDFSVGLAYNFSAYEVTPKQNTGVPVAEEGNPLTFIAGVHIYFKRMNKLNHRWFRHWDERFSLYLGLGIKNTLDNYYPGISYDMTPGIRLMGGWHLYRNFRYRMMNDQIADRAAGLASAGPFVSISLEPVTIMKAIGFFK